MTLTPSRYKESVLLAALQDRHTYTARKSALSCARSHSPRHIISPPACPPLATAREWYIRESQHTKEEHTKKVVHCHMPQIDKNTPDATTTRPFDARGACARDHTTHMHKGL